MEKKQKKRVVKKKRKEIRKRRRRRERKSKRGLEPRQAYIEAVCFCRPVTQKQAACQAWLSKKRETRESCVCIYVYILYSYEIYIFV